MRNQERSFPDRRHQYLFFRHPLFSERGRSGRLAARCLGFPYTLIGKVVNGYHEGRKLGFPTANLDISHFGQLIPAPGVYAVRVRLENTVVWKRGMMNVGNRPTFNGRQLTLETTSSISKAIFTTSSCS